MVLGTSGECNGDANVSVPAAQHRRKHFPFWTSVTCSPVPVCWSQVQLECLMCIPRGARVRTLSPAGACGSQIRLCTHCAPSASLTLNSCSSLSFSFLKSSRACTLFMILSNCSTTAGVGKGIRSGTCAYCSIVAILSV